jgi:hypothetical protein
LATSNELMNRTCVFLNYALTIQSVSKAIEQVLCQIINFQLINDLRFFEGLIDLTK